MLFVEPLRWPEFYQARSEESKTFWQRLPLIGWLFASSDYEAVAKSIKEQLLARPKPDPHLWGDDPQHVQMAQYLCRVIQEEYEWPNDHFVPDDPCEIVFLLPWDDLEIVELVMRIEEELGFEVPDDEAEKWSGVLDDVVSFLVAKQQQAAAP
jgi:acyl carrier protein